MASLLPTIAWIFLTFVSGFISLFLFGAAHDLESKNMLMGAWISLVIFITSFTCI